MNCKLVYAIVPKGESFHGILEGQALQKAEDVINFAKEEGHKTTMTKQQIAEEYIKNRINNLWS
jgi:hypothetical protein